MRAKQVVAHTSSTAAEAVVRALVAAGVDHAFTVPGESFLGLLDALHDDPRIRVVATRHEGGAAFMAEAYAKLTRRPAVCVATRAVGAMNLGIGVHTAQQDCTPLIAIVGQVATSRRHREAFQEAELAQLFSPISKYALEPDDPERLGQLTYKAAHIAVHGRPGPVVLVVREDLFGHRVALSNFPPLTRDPGFPSDGAVSQALQLLRGAARPVILAGAGVLADDAVDVLVRLAEAEHIPVVASFRRPDVFPNDHELYLGHSGLGALPSVTDTLNEADVLLTIGCRLDENTTLDYSVPSSGTQLIHVDRDGYQSSYQATQTITSDSGPFITTLLRLIKETPGKPATYRAQRARVAALRQRWEDDTVAEPALVRPGFADQFAIAGHLRRLVPQSAVVVTDAGNFSSWGGRYLRWSEPGTFLGPVSGAMGYAVPAAVAATMAAPDRQVIALAGDGGFLMTGAELETAVRERTPIIVIVYNNEQYGTIRMHQQRQFPGRPTATTLGPVRICGFAEALGASAFEVRAADEFPAAFSAALNCAGPSVIEVVTDPEQISVNSTSHSYPAGVLLSET